MRLIDLITTRRSSPDYSRLCDPHARTVSQIRCVYDAQGTPTAAVTALEAVVPASLLRTKAAHTGGCFGLAWDRGGKRLASAGADKTVKLWDSSGNQLITLHVRCRQQHLPRLGQGIYNKIS